ncbi:hypothetical protein RCC89_02950 [Cytophagaceae bacterium ABcell3]|nr:hypothetical protein RCC89_02950 [Cytophagaceae bacterium ABcell3]
MRDMVKLPAFAMHLSAGVLSRDRSLLQAGFDIYFRTVIMKAQFLILSAIFFVLLSCKKEPEEEVSLEGDKGVSLFFSSNRTGNYEIYVKKDGSLVQVTDDKNLDSWWLRVSPDGKTLICYRSRAINKNNNYEDATLWSMNLDGSDAKKLIALDDNQWKAQGVADWSPDGTQLVMAAIEGASNRWHLFITDSNGKNAKKVSSRTSIYLDPSFSPDGSKIVFSSFPLGYNGTDLAKLEIYTMNTDGSEETRLTFDDIRDHDPYWAPDGKEIAFESAMEPEYLDVGKWALRSVEPDGSNLRVILHDGHINTVPRWNKSSEVLYFHKLNFGAPGFRIYKVSKDGSGLKQLTSGPGHYDDTDVEVVD